MQRIVYLSWPANEIAGGIKVAYQHVESLRAAGYDAIVATPDGKPPEWFQTSAPTLTLDKLGESTDILVFPENHAGLLRTFKERGCPKVVLCQNQFMAYRGLGGQTCYSEFGVTDVIATGRLVAAFCERRFPKLRIGSVPVFVDTELFRVNTSKKLQIAYAPRKRPMEAAFIKDLFQAENPQWRAIPWIAISGIPASEVARILGDSAVYLSLCRFEAFPLSILEALACGCVVAGFTGFGGRVYTTAANGFWCETKLVDDPNSPYYPAVKRLQQIRDLTAARDMNRGHIKNAIDEAVLAAPGELEKRTADQMRAAEERKQLAATGTLKGAIVVGDVTPDVLNELTAISTMLSGTLQEQTDARTRLQTLIETLQPKPAQ